MNVERHRMRMPLTLAVLTLFMLTAPLRAADLPTAVQRALYEASQAMTGGDHAKAARILGQYQQNHPDDPHHLVEFALGNALSMQGKTAPALHQFQRSTELEPGYAPAWQNMGKTALDLGNHALAGAALSRAYELGGAQDHDMLMNACAAFIMGGKTKEAVPGLERLTSGTAGKPKPQWLEALLKVYLDLGQEKKAALVLEGLLTANGDNAELWKLLAKLRARQNDYTKSLAAWEIYSSLHLLTPEEQVLVGDLYAAIGVPAKAAESYEQALTRKECPRLREKLVNAYVASRDTAKAIRSAQQAIEHAPSPGLWLALGRALYEQGKFHEALAAFGQSARLNPQNGTVHLLRAHCALRLKDRSVAVAALEQARQFPAYRDQATALLKVATTL